MKAQGKTELLCEGIIHDPTTPRPSQMETSPSAAGPPPKRLFQPILGYPRASALPRKWQDTTPVLLPERIRGNPSAFAGLKGKNLRQHCFPGYFLHCLLNHSLHLIYTVTEHFIHLASVRGCVHGNRLTWCIFPPGQHTMGWRHCLTVPGLLTLAGEGTSPRLKDTLHSTWLMLKWHRSSQRHPQLCTAPIPTSPVSWRDYTDRLGRLQHHSLDI